MSDTTTRTMATRSTAMTPIQAIVFLILLACAFPVTMIVWAASIHVARLVW